jgi:hypothetical protein
VVDQIAKPTNTVQWHRRLTTGILGLFQRIFAVLLGWLKPPFCALLDAWTHVSPVVEILRYTRVASLSVLAGLVILIMTGQGQEIALSLAEPIADISSASWSGWASWIAWVAWLALVQAAVVWWAFSCSLMAGFNLDMAKSVRTNQGRSVAWAGGLLDRAWPQLLLLACFLVYLTAIGVATVRLGQLSWPLIGLLFVNVALAGTALRLLWKQATGPLPPPPTTRVGKAMSGRAPELEGVTVIMAVVMLVALVALFSVYPLSAAQVFGSPVVLFCFLAIATSILGALSKAFHPSRFPVLTLIVAWPFAASLSPWNDNHEVRSLATLTDQSERSDIPNALALWKSSLGADDCRVKDKPNARRLIVVATAGGGLRAAYWTATVLGSLQDSAPQFRKCLFAISGVSGGSLGAVLFTAALAEGSSADDPKCADNRKRIACRLDKALSRDFLGPAAGGLLFPDLVQRFLPWPTVFPDRAEALERAWEEAFYRKGGTSLDNDFLALWSPKRFDLPYLLLNGTDADTGTRIVTSSLQLTDAFPETLDYFDLSHTRIRLSTAAMNSARFTYVSPAGTIPYRSASGDSAQEGQVQARIIDGGYFENYGAQTALDLLKAVERADRAHPDDRSRIEVTVIQISSDPGLRAGAEPDLADCEHGMGLTAARGEGDGWFERMRSRFGNEVVAPIGGMLMTRESRGLLAAKQLACTVGDPTRYAHFRMKPRPWPGGVPWGLSWALDKDGEHPPLGWLLTSRARKQINDQLDQDCGTSRAFNKVLALLDMPARPSAEPIAWGAGESCDKLEVAMGGK